MKDNEELGMSLHLGETSEVGNLSSVLRGQKYGSNTRHSTMFENGVLVLDMIGPIYPRANMMTSSGAVSLQQFVSEYVTAYNDPDVKGMVINVDSPGGDVRGLSDASAIMSKLSQKRKKPVKTFASGYMASAAYHLGSVGQEIVGSRSAMVGSIGVVSKVQALPSGQYEITSVQSPYKRTDPTTPDGQEVTRELCTAMAAVMIEDIASNRGVSQEKVLSDYGQGKTLVGPTAKKQGLIDSIGTLASVVESVAKEAQTGSYRQVNNKRKVSAELADILSFSDEENTTMSLKSLADKFRASNDEVDETVPEVLTEETPEETPEAQPETPPTAQDPEALAARRDELEETFSEGAELFATQMTVASRILPSQQAHVASDFLTAKIDDAIFGGAVNYVNAEGDVVSGTREEAAKARYESFPKHTMTQKAIAGIKSGDVAASILKPEPRDKDKSVTAEEDEAPISAERREHLLSLTSQGRKVLASQ